jgi:hypothetical protein
VCYNITFPSFAESFEWRKGGVVTAVAGYLDLAVLQLARSDFSFASPKALTPFAVEDADTVKMEQDSLHS